MKVVPFCLAVLLTLLAPGTRPAAASRAQIDLSGPGWKLWLDKDAQWKNDPLFAPSADLKTIPSNPPTGGWDRLQTAEAVAVSVPGTVEEYLQATPGPTGTLPGVSWWFRTIQIPPASSPRRVLLRFEATRLRTEVYVDRKLAGYNLVDSTPFQVDLTGFAKPGQSIQLAIRITNPGGNYDYHDKNMIRWGQYRILGGHGFGGITGRVRLDLCDEIYIDDLYIQNTPAPTTIHALLTLNNTTPKAVQRDLAVRIVESAGAAAPVAQQQLQAVNIPPGLSTVPVSISMPAAKLWDPDHPNLYLCQASIVGDQSEDAAEQTFGFRWFQPVGIGKDAQFLLNGKRIVLRSAISWGYWPINGLYATPDLARKQIQAAKDLGLNMLNFHRCVGQPVILEKADEMGLLYYEEPGGYDSGNGADNTLARAIAREKWLRMVKRDRSHPSLILFSMSNETSAAGQSLDNYVHDMKDAHALDPSHTFLRASGLRSSPGMDVEMSTKVHMLPFDDTVYSAGWYDDHHAGGWPVWTQSAAYKNPADYYHREIHDPAEILFFGEEGALSTPPRLGLIKDALAHEPHVGWDGQMYLEWYKMFDDFLTAKHLRSAFPTVDAFCQAMGNISMEHQGRRIQVIRINNDNDAYVVNGWESELIDNHSGIVDCFRNPKGDPAIMAYYNQPLYVAIEPRSQILPLGSKAIVDFFLINEKDVHGPHRLHITAGKNAFDQTVDVSVIGGSTYGQLLHEAVEIPVSTAGRIDLNAALLDADNNTIATGHDWILALDWKSARFNGRGALLDEAGHLRHFFASAAAPQFPEYADNAGPLDWIVAAAPPNARTATPVPADCLHTLTASFFIGNDRTHTVHQRSDDVIDLFANEGAPPDPAVDALSNYTVRWQGQLLPPATGEYTFTLQATGSATVTINNQTVSSVAPAGRNRRADSSSHPIQLQAGQPATLQVEWTQSTGDAACRLLWTAPNATAAPDAQKLIQRVMTQGTTLIIIDNADAWLSLAAKANPQIKYAGAFRVGTNWLGGVHFVRDHPLFKGLPTNDGMNWPYAAVVRDGNARLGLLLDGDDLAAGVFHSHNPAANPPSPIHLGTAVGVLPCGKGHLIVSTLDLLNNLNAPPAPPMSPENCFATT